jgi:hypothetical protein
VLEIGQHEFLQVDRFRGQSWVQQPLASADQQPSVTFVAVFGQDLHAAGQSRRLLRRSGQPVVLAKELIKITRQPDFAVAYHDEVIAHPGEVAEEVG